MQSDPGAANVATAIPSLVLLLLGTPAAPGTGDPSCLSLLEAQLPPIKGFRVQA